MPLQNEKLVSISSDSEHVVVFHRSMVMENTGMQHDRLVWQGGKEPVRPHLCISQRISNRQRVIMTLVPKHV